jgi:hypothetical protein
MALVGNISGSSLQNSVVGVSGTLIVADRSNSLFPTFPGSDVSFFVSGSVGGRNGLTRNIGSFGGDLVVSGVLAVNNAITASGGIYATGDVLDVSGSFLLTGSAYITGFVSASALTGSLTRLSDGTPYLLAGTNITLSTGSNGAVTIAAATQAQTPQYWFSSVNGVTYNTGSLVALTHLSASNGAEVTGSVSVTGFVSASALTGSLTRLSDGSPYLLAGTYITLSTGSNGAVTITANAQPQTPQYWFSDVAGVTYNTGSITAMQHLSASSGAEITGSVSVTGFVSASALTGSLTTLSDGSPYLLAGTYITLSTGSNGAVTINAAAQAQTPQYWFSNVNGVTYNTGSLVAMTHLSASNGAEITGSVYVTNDVIVTGSAIINGDLTVKGTTTTIDTTNLLVKDSLIGLGFASGSVAQTAGDRGFIGGLSGGDNVSVFWSNGNSEVTIARTNSAPDATSVTVTSYAKLHAGDISGSAGTFSGNLVVSGNVTLGDATSDTLTFNARAATDLLPSADLAYNLGSANLRWANIYTGDLHLRNDRGHYTIIEEEDYLSIRNNKSGKLYKFVLEEVGAPKSSRKSRKTK